MKDRLFGLIIFLNCAIFSIQHPGPVMDQTMLAENAKKFIELYGLATQLMNMGGRFLGNGQSAGSSDDGGGNGVLSEVVRPQFRGVTNYQPNYDQSNSLNEYGGGPLGGGSRGVQSAQRSAIDRLLNTFLGSSFGSGGSEASSNLFSPGYGTDYGSDSSRFGSSGSGSNIDALIGALSASGAKPARPEPESRSLLSQFFGRR